jgi:hypothetical protein
VIAVRTYNRPSYITSLANDFEHAHLCGFGLCEVPDDLLPMDGLRNLPRKIPSEPGIYFMWRGPQLLYIGSSMDDMEDRIYVHRRAQMGTRRGHRRYRFTHFTCMEHALVGLHDLEYRYIQAYIPPFNEHLTNPRSDTRVPLTRGSHTAGREP